MPERLQGFKWLIRSSTIIFIGSVVGQVIGITATMLLSRSLGLEAFGQFSILIGLITLSAGLTTNAFSRSQARFTANYLGQEDGESLMGTLYFGLLASLICSVVLALVIAARARRRRHPPSRNRPSRHPARQHRPREL